MDSKKPIKATVKPAAPHPVYTAFLVRGSRELVKLYSYVVDSKGVVVFPVRSSR